MTIIKKIIKNLLPYILLLKEKKCSFCGSKRNLYIETLSQNPTFNDLDIVCKKCKL